MRGCPTLKPSLQNWREPRWRYAKDWTLSSTTMGIIKFGSSPLNLVNLFYHMFFSYRVCPSLHICCGALQIAFCPMRRAYPKALSTCLLVDMIQYQLAR
jgi:hypothetical protein